MTPYHVARSKMFVRERFGKAGLRHLDTIEIEATSSTPASRFPRTSGTVTDDFPGLFRAADLIGQLADISYLPKTSALFNEFRETGMTEVLKYDSPSDLRAHSPQFFWQVVRPYIEDALRYLQSHSRRKTVDLQSLCERVLDGA